MHLNEISIKYQSQEACIQLLEKIRWNDKVICPYCTSTFNKKLKNELRHKCHDCKRSFSVLIGTVFEATKLPLFKWFLAIATIVDAKKGVSSLQLSRNIQVNKDTAWFLQKRIREAMSEDVLLDGIVQIDEAYVGGSLENKSSMERANIDTNCGTQYRSAVLGMVEQKGRIKLQVIDKVWGKEVKPILYSTITSRSEIVTDGHGSYYGINEKFKTHVVLNHRKKQRSSGKFNMNTIEGFWAMLKRAVIGTYHKITSKYLQNYVDEMAFKYNYRNHSDSFSVLLFKLLGVEIPLRG